MNRFRLSKGRIDGFTLIEAVMTIVIVGILASVVAGFITRPVEGYVNAVRRADLTDAADTALRRIVRDVRTALPNSLRTTSPGSTGCFEFLPVVGGGRYRAAQTSALTGDILDFSVSDSSFDVLAGNNLPDFSSSTYHAVIYNLGIPGADAYDVSNHNRAQIGSAATSSSIVLSAANKFPFESPGMRFLVIPDYAVVYSCSGTQLLRSTRAISASKLASCPASGTVLVGNVNSCSFNYTSAVSGRNGLLTMTLVLTDQSGESVRLYNEVHVDNVP